MSFMLESAPVIFHGLSVGAGVAGNIFSSRVESANALNRAAVDRFNALVAEQQAKAELDSARADASDFRKAHSARVASFRARQAGSGFAYEGSPMVVDEAAMTEIEFGVSRIMHRGQVREHRLQQEASLLRHSAKVEEANAKAARRAGIISAIGGALRGIASTPMQGFSFG